jgi:hypothetical protein
VRTWCERADAVKHVEDAHDAYGLSDEYVTNADTAGQVRVGCGLCLAKLGTEGVRYVGRNKMDVLIDHLCACHKIDRPLAAKEVNNHLPETMPEMEQRLMRRVDAKINAAAPLLR